jgi:hypothetical protein
MTNDWQFWRQRRRHEAYPPTPAAPLGGGAAAGLDLTATGRPDGRAEAAGDAEALRLRAPGGEGGGGSSEPAVQDSDGSESSTPKYTRSLSAVGWRGAEEPPGIGTTGARGEGGGVAVAQRRRGGQEQTRRQADQKERGAAPGYSKEWGGGHQEPAEKSGRTGRHGQYAHT